MATTTKAKASTRKPTARKPAKKAPARKPAPKKAAAVKVPQGANGKATSTTELCDFQLTIYIPTALYEGLYERAVKDDRKVSATIRHALKVYLAGA